MPLDDETKAAIAAAVTEALKGEEFATAIASAAGAATKQQIGSAIKGLKIDDKIAQAVEGLKPDPGPGAGDGGEGNNTDPKVAAQLKALQQQLADEKSARESAENARKEESMLSALRTALGANDVPPARMKAAVALLHHAEGRVKLDEQGRPGLHQQHDGWDEIVPLEKAIPEWLKSDDGKNFLPASGVQGTGGGAGGKPGGSKGGSTTQAGDLATSLLNGIFG